MIIYFLSNSPKLIKSGFWKKVNTLKKISIVDSDKTTSSLPSSYVQILVSGR